MRQNALRSAVASSRLRRLRRLGAMRSRVGWWLAGATVWVALALWAAQDRLLPGERALAVWLQEHRFPGLLSFEEFADLIGYAGTLWWLVGIGGLGVLLARRLDLLALVLIAPFLTRLGPAAKDLVERPRPTASQVSEVRNYPGGFGFPSGHSLRAAVIGAVVFIAAEQLLSGRWRRLFQGLAICFAATIGWERVFDGVHWPSDVAGGFLLGVLATAAAWGAIKRLSRLVGKARTGATNAGTSPTTGAQRP